jgi:uncharacterized protein (TIGR04255 family)
MSRGDVLAEADPGHGAAAIAAEFKSPPITEVGLAVSFQPLGFGIIDLGDLWREKFASEFPVVQEQPPIQLPVERFDRAPAEQPTFSFDLVPAPTLPRLWFLNETGTELLQVQSEWFGRNWRETAESDQKYPLYATLREAFERNYRSLVEFANDRNRNVLPVQAEVTYTNHIDEPDPVRVLVSLQAVPGLPAPEGTGLSARYVLSRDAGPAARLHIQASTAIHKATNRPISVLNLTVRGRPMGDGIEGTMAFLDYAAEQALEAFISLTRPEMHEQWRQG